MGYTFLDCVFVSLMSQAPVTESLMSERGSVLSCVFTTLVVVEITHTLVSGSHASARFVLLPIHDRNKTRVRRRGRGEN